MAATSAEPVPFVESLESDACDATDSVVIIVLPEQSPAAGRPLIGDNRDTNHPVGRAVERIGPRGYLTQGTLEAVIWLRSVGAGARSPLPVAATALTCPDDGASPAAPGWASEWER